MRAKIRPGGVAVGHRCRRERPFDAEGGIVPAHPGGGFRAERLAHHVEDLAVVLERQEPVGAAGRDEQRIAPLPRQLDPDPAAIGRRIRAANRSPHRRCGRRCSAPASAPRTARAGNACRAACRGGGSTRRCTAANSPAVRRRRSSRRRRCGRTGRARRRAARPRPASPRAAAVGLDPHAAGDRSIEYRQARDRDDEPAAPVADRGHLLERSRPSGSTAGSEHVVRPGRRRCAPARGSGCACPADSAPACAGCDRPCRAAARGRCRSSSAACCPWPARRSRRPSCPPACAPIRNSSSLAFDVDDACGETRHSPSGSVSPAACSSASTAATRSAARPARLPHGTA